MLGLNLTAAAENDTEIRLFSALPDVALLEAEIVPARDVGLIIGKLKGAVP